MTLCRTCLIEALGEWTAFLGSAGITYVRRMFKLITSPWFMPVTDISDVCPAAVSAGIFAAVAQGAVNISITAVKPAFQVGSAVKAFVWLMHAIRNALCIATNLFGHRSRIFLQHTSNLLEAASLQEFLFDIKPVGEGEVFLRLPDSMSHCQSFPADRRPMDRIAQLCKTNFHFFKKSGVGAGI